MKELLKSLKEFTIYFIIMFVIELIITLFLFFISFNHKGTETAYPFNCLPIFVVGKEFVNINFYNMLIVNIIIALLLSTISFFFFFHKNIKNMKQKNE